MFTGIIEATGTILAITPTGGDIKITIRSDSLPFGDIKLGDSIASNGVCLTVVAISGNSYMVDVSRETLYKTTLGSWQVGDTLNLEKAMLPTTRFGGHMVAGHVDGVGTIHKIQKDARSIYIEITLPAALMKYVADKGSVAVDGISLTTNTILSDKNIICLNIIPHTANTTNISKHWQVGHSVNIEVDLIARYLERLLMSSSDTNQSQSSLSEDFLLKSGFNRSRN